MRVKYHQIRANVAFTKPLTTHLMRGKGDFSCRVRGEGGVRPTLKSAPDFRRIKLVHDASLTAACKKWLPFAPKSSVQICQC